MSTKKPFGNWESPYYVTERGDSWTGNMARDLEEAMERHSKTPGIGKHTVIINAMNEVLPVHRMPPRSKNPMTDAERKWLEEMRKPINHRPISTNDAYRAMVILTRIDDQSIAECACEKPAPDSTDSLLKPERDFVETCRKRNIDKRCGYEPEWLEIMDRVAPRPREKTNEELADIIRTSARMSVEACNALAELLNRVDKK